MLIGYARVSTIDQNPALQMDALKTAGCDKVFTEKASGSHRDRPQLKAALNYLREGDTLVVWKLSRLARSLTQVIKTATDINDRGIALKVLTQNIDTSTSEGRLFFHMTAAFDEFQRELIVENTRAGLAAANKRGRRGGRPRAMNEQTIKHAEAMLKDTENYPFIGDVIDQLKIGEPLSTDISQQIASNSSEMSTKQTFRQAKTYVASRTFMQTDPVSGVSLRDAVTQRGKKWPCCINHRTSAEYPYP